MLVRGAWRQAGAGGRRRVLLVRLGTLAPVFPELVARRGDYDALFAQAMGVARERMVVMSPPDGDRPPRALAGIGAVVLTGSAAMVGERAPWSERTAHWLRRVVAAGEVPVLGVCYGHQLLAHALGGGVGWAPQGLETGAVPIALTCHARRDPLFRGLPRTLWVHTHHHQTVLRAPPGVRVLARNRHGPVQAFAAGRRAWGVQFHPEFDAEVAACFLRHDAARGQLDAATARRRTATLDAPRHGPWLLRRLAALAGVRTAPPPLA